MSLFSLVIEAQFGLEACDYSLFTASIAARSGQVTGFDLRKLIRCLSSGNVVHVCVCSLMREKHMASLFPLPLLPGLNKSTPPNTVAAICDHEEKTKMSSETCALQVSPIQTGLPALLHVHRPIPLHFTSSFVYFLHIIYFNPTDSNFKYTRT